MITKGGRWGWIGMDWGFGISICTLRYMEWLATWDLLYSARNSTRYSVMAYMGKESEKNGCVYMYHWITLLCSRNDHNLVNQLYFNKNFKKKMQSLRCHRTSTSAPRVCGLTQLIVFLGLWRSAASRLQPNYVSSIQFWGTFCFALCPRIALPHCDSMTTRCCFLCGWPLRETLWIFANWCIYSESSISASFYSLGPPKATFMHMPLKKKKKKKTNPGTGVSPPTQGWPSRQLCFPSVRDDEPSCILRNCMDRSQSSKPY